MLNGPVKFFPVVNAVSSRSHDVRKYVDAEVYTKPCLNVAKGADFWCGHPLGRGETIDTLAAFMLYKDILSFRDSILVYILH